MLAPSAESDEHPDDPSASAIQDAPTTHAERCVLGRSLD